MPVKKFERISILPCPWHMRHSTTMGYLEAQENAYKRIKDGEKQIQCHVCGFWFWPEYFGEDPITNLIKSILPPPPKTLEKILNQNIMTPQQQQKNERIEKLSIIINEIISSVAANKPIKFEELVHSHGVLWNSGVRSLLSILKNKMKLLDYKERKKNTYQWTALFHEKYDSISMDEVIADIAKKLFVQTEKWQSRPRKIEQSTPTISTVPGSTHEFVEMTPLEKYALITHLQAHPAQDPAVKMILEQFITKLNA